MTEIAFEAFPKIARMRRNIVVTEKIDGTNAQIYIADGVDLDQVKNDPYCLGTKWNSDGSFLAMYAGSRNKWVAPEGTYGLEKGCDNFAFGKFVKENMGDLFKLGPGRHFGEWWGQGIQRKYGIDCKRFSLFNAHRWTHNEKPECCDVVPTLYSGPWSDLEIADTLKYLRYYGSQAATGFMNPEGVVIYHEALRSSFKITLKNDEKPKSQVAT